MRSRFTRKKLYSIYSTLSTRRIKLYVRQIARLFSCVQDERGGVPSNSVRRNTLWKVLTGGLRLFSTTGHFLFYRNIEGAVYSNCMAISSPWKKNKKVIGCVRGLQIKTRSKTPGWNVRNNTCSRFHQRFNELWGSGNATRIGFIPYANVTRAIASSIKTETSRCYVRSDERGQKNV